jgi:hypothetical protein
MRQLFQRLPVGLQSWLIDYWRLPLTLLPIIALLGLILWRMSEPYQIEARLPAQVIGFMDATDDHGYRGSFTLRLPDGTTAVVSTTSPKRSFSIGTTACVDKRVYASGHVRYALSPVQDCDPLA